MTAKEELELSIRAAQIAKDALALLGVKNLGVAKLMLQQVAERLVEADKWLETVEP